MSGWLFGGLFLVGYFAVGVLAARVAAWLHRAGFIWISLRDWEGIMVCLLLAWPVVVPIWAVVKLIGAVLPGPSERR